MVDQAERLRMLVREQMNVRIPRNCRTIAVTSGKGGVGKTTVAVNLAVLLAGLDKSTAIVDADLGLSNVDVTLGLLPKYHLGHVLDGGMRLEDVSTGGPFGLKVVSGGSGVEKLANLTDLERIYLMEQIHEFSCGFDFLIIDTSPGIGRNVTDFLAAADQVIVVTTPEPTSLADCYAAIKTIFQNRPDAAVSLLVNRTSDRNMAAQVAGSIDTVLYKFVGKHLGSWMYLPEDASVGSAGYKQKALVEAYSSSPAAAALRKMAVMAAGSSTVLADNGRRETECIA